MNRSKKIVRERLGVPPKRPSFKSQSSWVNYIIAFIIKKQVDKEGKSKMSN